MKITITIYKNGYTLFWVASSANCDASLIGILRSWGIGQIRTMPKILKSKCPNATDSDWIVPVARLASIDVMVVPIFAPKE